MDRRQYLKLSAATAFTPLSAAAGTSGIAAPDAVREINMAYDGRFLSPGEHVAALARIVEERDIQPDFYGVGGAVTQLEEVFATLSGKEAGLYLPSGTLANQLAIKVLSGNKSKVLVQDDSHIYRDEADAAQLVHNKRLVSMTPGGQRLGHSDLLDAIDHYRGNEVFETGIGAISVENPVRRRLEETVDFGELEKISAFAREQKIGLHLDGARLFMASQWTGNSIEAYSTLFDTVYFSLYKYLGARAGAVLTGDAAVIDEVKFWMKPLGGVAFQSWPDAAIALDSLDGIEQRLGDVREQSETLLSGIGQLPGLRIERIPHGCHAAKLYVDAVDAGEFTTRLYDRHNILLRDPTRDGFIMLKMNETLLGVSPASIYEAFTDALQT